MELLHNDRVDIRLYSPQALAFLGDAVYEILVRERIVHKANMPVNKLHLQAVEQVRASYQSRAYASSSRCSMRKSWLRSNAGGTSARSSRPKRQYDRLPSRHWFGVSVRLPVFAGQGSNASTSCLQRLNLSWSQTKR